MSTSGWKWNWGFGRGSRDLLGMLVRIAVRGAPMNRLLELGARSLLIACAADRAGIWLAEPWRGQRNRGEVLENVPGPVPGMWKRLDISTPFLRSAMESEDPVRVECGSAQNLAQIGPLVGMQSATWIPIRARKRVLGLGMVAYARPGVEVDPVLLRGLSDGIALSVACERDTQRHELAEEELRSRLRLMRALQAGVSAEALLAQMARVARHASQAEFIALGKSCETGRVSQAWDGPAEWRAVLMQPAVQQAWQKVLQEGQEIELAGNSFHLPGVLSDGQHFPPLERIIALPLVAGGAVRGVLLAGLRKTEHPGDAPARLDSYALLAATALELEMARQERAASARLWQNMIRASQEPLAVMDEQGIVIEVSPGARAVLFADGVSSPGLRLEDLFSPFFREAVAEWREQLTASTEPVPAPQLRLHPLEGTLANGAAVCIRLRLQLDIACVGSRQWLIHFEERDACHAQAEAVSRLQAEMAGLLDSIDFGVLLLNSQGKIHLASERLGEILGLDARRLLELGSADALIDTLSSRLSRSAETAARWRDHLRQGEEVSWDEFELVRPARKIVERFTRPLFAADGTRLGWVEVYRDITGQRLIQSKLVQTEKMAVLGQLVSGIAHELNNPLTSIQGYAQLLLSRHSNTHRASDALRISQEAERASHIVKNLLSFSREGKAERRTVNVNEVIERTVAMRAYEMNLESIVVDLTLDPGLPQTLAVAAQLQQVILNLIVNAEQAILQKNGQVAETQNGQGRIAIRTRRLAADRIAIEVSDDGPGIPPEIVSRIFDPFFTTKPVGAGTGLGLSIVYGIVQEHGGEIGVESQPGHGAAFTVELPALAATTFDFAKEDAVAPPLPALRSRPASGQAETRPESVLVVEDEPTVAQLIADVLGEEGHRVDVLLDSREALQRLEKSNYDLVICDLKMPYLDGAGLYRALSRMSSASARRLLFVTGDTMSPRTLDFLRSTGVPYLAKPFLVEELKAAVQRALAANLSEEEVAIASKGLRVVRES